MESWHRVGQKVVCVNAVPYRLHDKLPFFNALPLSQGFVYTIREVDIDDEGVVFTFDELRNKKTRWGNGKYEEAAYWAQRFRPVQTTSIESLRALLASPPDPDLVREEADERTREVVGRLAQMHLFLADPLGYLDS